MAGTATDTAPRAPVARARGERRPLWIPAVEFLALAAFAWLWTSAALGAAAVVGARPALWLLAAPLALLALLTADLASGVAHWACDRCFDESAPVVGALIVRTFREHHADPQALVAHGFVELNGASALALLPLLGLAHAAPGPGAGAVAFALHAGFLVFALAILLTNCVHRWAHAARVPRAAAWLQRRALVLSPTAHAAHHAGDHTRAFCITTGWWNGVLDRTGFFAGLERVAARVAGARHPRDAAGIERG